MWMRGRARSRRRRRAGPDPVGEAVLELGDEGSDGRHEARLDGLEHVVGARARRCWARRAGSCPGPRAHRARAPRALRRRLEPPGVGGVIGGTAPAVVGVDPRRAATRPSRARPSSSDTVGRPAEHVVGDATGRTGGPAPRTPPGRIRACSVTISAVAAGDRPAQVDDLADRDRSPGAELDRRARRHVGQRRPDEAVGGVGDEGEVALRRHVAEARSRSRRRAAATGRSG